MLRRAVRRRWFLLALAQSLVATASRTPARDASHELLVLAYHELEQPERAVMADYAVTPAASCPPSRCCCPSTTATPASTPRHSPCSSATAPPPWWRMCCTSAASRCTGSWRARTAGAGPAGLPGGARRGPKQARGPAAAGVRLLLEGQSRPWGWRGHSGDERSGPRLPLPGGTSPGGSSPQRGRPGLSGHFEQLTRGTAC